MVYTDFGLKITSIHNRLATEMNKYIQKAEIPAWMTKVKTTVIQKDPLKGTVPSNYWPITYLPMMWKILTVQIREKIYNSLISRGIFPNEKNGCRKRTRDTEELQYIDQHILNESKTRRQNLPMAWIDNKITSDMVPQSCLKVYKIPDQIVQFIEKTMETWRFELIAGGKILPEVKIQRDIFPGDALPPLLFVIAIMSLNHIFRKCIAGYKLSKSQKKNQPRDLHGQHRRTEYTPIAIATWSTLTRSGST